MSIIVQKFGGSSVSNTEKLFNVCTHIINEYEKGNKIVVVVSAQGKTTDKLLLEEAEITDVPSKREHDVLASVGEQITISKLALCLQKMGYDAISYLGWQIPIITNNSYGNARIKYIDDTKIIEDLNNKKIVIVAGFQGINEDNNITTLGRGGSDTTAVALAATLKAERCDIYTDVDGVFSADPRLIKDSVKIERITYDEMLELASSGAKVLHNRCVEIGKNFKIPIIVKSTFKQKSIGTIVNDRRELETLNISGISKIDNISRVTLIGINCKKGDTYKIFKLLADNNITIDIIVQSFGENTIKDISFSILTEDLEKTLLLLNKNSINIKFEEILYLSNLSKISLVGVGLTTTPGIVADLFEGLYENNINIHTITTSETKISVLVNKKEVDIAMNTIHNKFKKYIDKDD